MLIFIPHLFLPSEKSVWEKIAKKDQQNTKGKCLLR